jgi:isoamylase
MHVMISAYSEPLQFELPSARSKHAWYRSIDTSLASPDDIAEEGTEVEIRQTHYSLASRSTAVLVAKPL